MFHIVLEENVGNKSKLHLRFTNSQVRLAKHTDKVFSELRQKNPSEVIFDYRINQGVVKKEYISTSIIIRFKIKI